MHQRWFCGQRGKSHCASSMVVWILVLTCSPALTLDFTFIAYLPSFWLISYALRGLADASDVPLASGTQYGRWGTKSRKRDPGFSDLQSRQVWVRISGWHP